MEYAENGSLLDIIRKDSHIDETRSRKWFRQLVDAVDYCHERGVVHRYSRLKYCTSSLSYILNSFTKNNLSKLIVNSRLCVRKFSDLLVI